MEASGCRGPAPPRPGPSVCRAEGRPRLAKWILLFSATLLATACIPHTLHRPEGVVRHGNFVQTFVELDDHGELWSPSQLDRVLAVLDEASAHPEGALINVFVHGWNHDASLDNEDRETGNVRGQQVLLEQLAESEATYNAENPRPVVGVYIAWRGRLLRGPLNFLTFYNRRQAANRVAGITATGTLYRILAAAKRNPRSRVALVGHSFGGLVVERTLSQALVGALFAPGAEQRESFELLADLVLLINPASPAIHAKQFVELLERNRLVLYRESPDGVRREMPAVVSITSEGDWATGLFYPAGLRLLATRKAFRRYGDEYCGASAPQRSYAVRTAGHHDLLQSHVVRAEALPESERPPQLISPRLEEMARWTFDPRSGQPVIVFEGDRHRFRIARKPRAFNDTPYWIMRVPTSLIPDHAQVFRFDTYRLIGALMVATGAFDTSAQRTLLLRQDGIRPIGMAPAVGGGMLVLDRSRRLFHITGDSREPRLFGCLPAELDPRDGLGFTYENGEYLSGSQPRENGDRPTTYLRRVRVRADRVETVEELALRSGEPFLAMAADLSGRRAFLIHGEGREVWQADLSRGRPEPELLASFEGLARLTLLQYQPGQNALFVANGDGILFRLDLETGERRVLVAGLGRPTALEYDAEQHRLYLADSLNRRIWRFDCGSGRCVGPVPHVDCEHLRRPTALRAMPGGELWVGDMSSEALARVSPEGEILLTYTSLRSPPVPGLAVGAELAFR